MEIDRIKTGAAVDRAFAAPNEPHIALWLKCYWHPTWHLGIAFRRRGEHEVTRLDQVDEGLRVGTDIEAEHRWWIFLPVDARSRARLSVASSRMKRIAERRPRVPYDHFYLGGTFNAQGTYVPASGELGLNCASLVLAVFESVEWPLIERASWATRSLDPVVVEAIENELTDAQQTVFRADQGLVILPTEVAGACLFALPRVPLQEAQRGAEHFVAQERASITNAS